MAITCSLLRISAATGGDFGRLYSRPYRRYSGRGITSFLSRSAPCNYGSSSCRTEAAPDWPRYIPVPGQPLTVMGVPITLASVQGDS